MKGEKVMFKKIIKKVSIITIVLAGLFGLTGCSGNPVDSEPVNAAFVLGIIDGESKIKTDMIDTLSTLPCSPGSSYAFISTEGQPVTIGDPGTIPDLTDRGYNSTMMERVEAGIRADLTERLESYEPTSLECDMAAATELAVRMLRANAVEGRENKLIFYCGGKSTSGIINMVETPVYKMDIESSVSTVAQQMNVDMSDIEVIWYCCGDYVNSSQAKLSNDEKKKLQSFYQQLFETLGAKKVTFMEDLPSNESYEFSSTPVSCMEVQYPTSGLQELDSEILKEADASVLSNPVVIPESQVRYKPDSAEFLDSAAAEAAIQPVADFLTEHPDVKILLYGTCAGDTDSEKTLQLGKDRANSIKQILVADGIDESRITAVTVKTADDPYHEFGLGTGSEASVNRKTVMVDMSSEFAKQILEKAI